MTDLCKQLAVAPDCICPTARQTLMGSVCFGLHVSQYSRNPLI